MDTMRRLALWITRQPWLPTVGPGLATVDAALQRWTGGRFAVVRLAGLTPVLLTTTGRRSGEPRTTPLVAIPEGGSLLLIASNWAKPGHPAWSANLIAEPHATIRTRGHAFPVTATLLTGAERAEAWATATAAWPTYRDYAARLDREIRVFRATLRERPSSAGGKTSD